MKHLLYHENNSKYPYLPQEDSYFHDINNGIFVVADGITHDVDSDGFYPYPSDAAEVSRIICRECVAFLKDKPFCIESIEKAFSFANQRVKQFNMDRDVYKNRESNGYDFGAAVVALAWIQGHGLLYGVLDDCYISVFGDDLKDHPTLKSYVDHSATLIDKGMDWNNISTRKFWRKELRNHKISRSAIDYGYGALDGSTGYDQYLQTGQVKLNNGDLVCVYSDGFINLLKNTDLIKLLRDNDFTSSTYEALSKFPKDLSETKEKTAYFIKI